MNMNALKDKVCGESIVEKIEQDIINEELVRQGKPIVKAAAIGGRSLLWGIIESIEKQGIDSSHSEVEDER